MINMTIMIAILFLFQWPEACHSFTSSIGYITPISSHPRKSSMPLFHRARSVPVVTTGTTPMRGAQHQKRSISPPHCCKYSNYAQLSRSPSLLFTQQQSGSWSTVSRSHARTILYQSASNTAGTETEPVEPQSILEGSSSGSNSSKNKAAREAQILRDKARALLAEANAAEQVLQDRKTRELKEVNADMDELIRLFSSVSNNDDNNAAIQSNNENGAAQKQQQQQQGKTRKEEGTIDEVVAIDPMMIKQIQSRHVSMENWIRLIDRLFEREQMARGVKPLGAGTDITKPMFTIGSESNVSLEGNPDESARLTDVTNRIILALEYIEKGAQEEKLQQKTKALSSSSPSRRGAESVSPVLRARWKELQRAEQEEFKRKVAVGVASMQRDATAGGGAGGESINDFIRRTLKTTSSSDEKLSGTSMLKLRGLDGLNETTSNLFEKDANMSQFMIDVIALPMWVPTSMLGFVATSKEELDREDVKLLKENVLGNSLFYCTSSNSMRLAAIYRGNFAATSSGIRRNVNSNPLLDGRGGMLSKGDMNRTEAMLEKKKEESLIKIGFQDVMDRFEKADNGRLAERVQLFLMDDPEWRQGDDPRQTTPKPVILAVPAAVKPEQGEIRGAAGTVLAVISVAASLFTTFAYSVAAYSLNSNFFNALVNDNDISVVKACIPIIIGVIALQGIHELAHILVAKRSNLKVGLPVPLPSLQLGSFGAITPLRSFPKSRSDLLDFALSGPLVQLLISTVLVSSGLYLTIHSSAEILPNLPVIPVALLKSSFLVSSIASFVAPGLLTLPLSQPVPIHPLVMIGLSGLLSSALNMLPIGRLDGGRACTAAFGRRTANLFSFLTLLLMAITSLLGYSNVFIFWGALTVLFQRSTEIQLMDEVNEVDDVRFGAYLVLQLLSVLILAPFPGGVGMM